MEKAALSSVGPGMMLLDTSRVASEGRSYATPAGRGSTVLNVSGFLLAIPTFLAMAQHEERPLMGHDKVTNV